MSFHEAFADRSNNRPSMADGPEYDLKMLKQLAEGASKSKTAYQLSLDFNLLLVR